MNKVLCLIIFCFYLSHITAQCPPGDVEFTNQNQVDQFIIDFPNCTELNGDLVLQVDFFDCNFLGNCFTNIVDLTPLINLISISGNLIISDTENLNNLSGLDNLKTANSLLIFNNLGLENLNMLEVSSLLNTLKIENNPLLTNISSIETIPEITSQLSLRDNANLEVCNYTVICDYLENPNLLNIENNANGCATVAEVEAECILSNTCLPDGITFNSQIEIDEFPQNYPNCNIIDGNVVIESPSLSDIKNLDSLYVLQKINGLLTIKDNSSNLFQMNGLSNLNHVEALFIEGNFYLENLLPLQGLTKCGYVEIVNNNNLVNLEGLNNIENFGEIRIISNPTLASLQGLESLDSIKFLQIRNNPSLLSLSGLNNLESVGSLFWLKNNAQLINFEGLENLKKIYGDFRIENNNSLTGLEGLEGLARVNNPGFQLATILIINNPNLISISNLNSLKKIESFFISSNGLLVDIDLPATLDTINVLSISNNDGLNNITFDNNSMIRSLNIEDNDQLVNLNGFANTNINTLSELNISSNDNLLSTSGLEGLVEIGFTTNNTDKLIIENNNNLQDLAGLENLQKINGSISIKDNLNLDNISALSNINPLEFPYEIAQINISDNPSLSECELLNFCTLLDLSDNVIVVMNNDLGCNSTEEIQINCEEFPPSCTTINFPSNSSMNISPTANIFWNEIPSADGYILTMGTSLNSGDLHDNVDVGNVTNFEPGVMPSGYTIYTKIQPYNENGMLNCDSEWFQTTGMPDLAISEGQENECIEIYDVTVDEANLNNVGIQHIVDNSGKIVCSFKANGNDLGLTHFSLYTQADVPFNEDGFYYFNRYITIEPTNQPIDPVTVILYYTMEEFDAISSLDPSINSINDIALTKQSMSCNSPLMSLQNSILQNESGSFNIDEGFYIEANFDSFSTIFAVSESTTLPVQWSKITRAIIRNRKAILTFSIAQQINNSHFEIQHSLEGRSWQALGTIEGAGTTSLEIDYEFLHKNPAVGYNYYRIKQVDFNGEYEYSNIASVFYRGDEMVQIYPNPATDIITIQSKNELHFIIVDINGKTIIQGDSAGKQNVDISELDQGIYFVRFSNGDVKRFVKS